MPLITATPPSQRYRWYEDVQGMLVASAQAALGIQLLRAGGLITGGTAGSALIISYVMGWNFSLTFFLLNLPFFAFAFMARGMVFGVKNIMTVVLVSLMAQLLSGYVIFTQVNPAAAALLFGASTGVGLLGLFRHNCSLGGVSIIALIAQERWGISAAKLQLVHDGLLFVVAAFLFPLPMVAWSLLGTVVLNGVILFNHRRDWYIAT